jgi:hypothetical protein
MFRQYHAQRRKGGHNPHGAGTIDVGSIFYLQDFRPFGRIRGGGAPVLRNPWIVEAWHPRELDGKYMRGGHLVTVRSLRDGQRRKIADWLLLAAREDGLEKN